MSDGFYLMHRGWRDNPVFRGDFSRGDAWVWLIENACWKATKFDIKGKIITLQRGQLCASRDRLASAWGWSGSAVERFLTRLQTEQMIGRETGQGKSVITISNYEKYQANSDGSGQESGQKSGQKSDRDRTAKEQGNKGTREPNGSHTPLPPIRVGGWPEIPDWVPAEQWNGWILMRKDKDKWPTPHAVKLSLGKLEELRKAGHDPGKVLDQSTLQSWTGLFKLKDEDNGNRGQRNGWNAPRDTRDGYTRELHGRLDLKSGDLP